MAFRSVAVLGASGSIGSHTIQLLLKTQQFSVRAIIRDSSKEFDLPSEVQVVRVDDSFSPSRLTGALQNIDVLLICFNDAANHLQPSIIDTAVQAGVKRIIPNHFSSNAELKRVQLFSSRTKDADIIVDYISSKEAHGVTWTAIVPGLFFDRALVNGFLGFSFSRYVASIWGSGSTTWSASTDIQIARTIVATIQHPQKTANQYVYVSSFSTSQNQILETLERQMGHKWTVRKIDRQAKVDASQRLLATGVEGMPRKLAQGTLALAMLFGAQSGDADEGVDYQPDFTAAGRSWNEKLGIPYENLEQICAGFVAKARKGELGFEAPDAVMYPEFADKPLSKS